MTGDRLTASHHWRHTSEEEGIDRTRAAYGTNWERLARVKAKWDPENVFRANKNIAPTAAGAA